MSELKALTGARGIAAWCVVAFHLRQSLAGVPAPVLGGIAKGYLAVDFFFLLSGFVIWLAWIGRFRSERTCAILPFLRKRVARVWPLHLFVLAGLVVLVVLLQASGSDTSVRFPWHALQEHVLLVQSWRRAHTLAWNDPAWSISAEFAAYLLFPLLAIAVDWRRWPSALLLAMTGGVLALLALVLAAAGETGLGGEVGRFGVLRCLCEFASGSMIAALWLRWRGSMGITGLAFGGAAVMLAALLCGFLWESIGVPAMFAALLLGIALTAGWRGNPLEWRWLHWLGEVSYATYLVHHPLWFTCKLLFVADERAAPWGVVAAYVAAVVVLSALLYRFVERPAQAWVNAFGSAQPRGGLRNNR
ncbi:acyltransferase [Sphingomonas sp. VNH70]|uniref:acyltransferase family protein n=1 Tax=Sphingomonas silueang TaxID=3156617 RepID=UPI0032B54005